MLDLEDEKRQVFSLSYAMGEKVDDIIDSFRLSDDDRNSYTMVRGRFEAYFLAFLTNSLLYLKVLVSLSEIIRLSCRITQSRSL